VLCQRSLAETVDRGCPLVLGGPLPHVIAAKAVALHEAGKPAFHTYAERVVANARTLAAALAERGARVVTGGTDNHLVLLDVSTYGISGRQAESALLDSGIVTNRNAIPRDPNGAWYTSGVRLGSPALTSRGFGTDDFDEVADLIVDVLAATSPATAASGAASKAKYAIAGGVADKTQARAAELLDRHPLYPGLDLG
jgi:glycine hydroxymethyltransferase